jgi:hypothetical protein
MAENNTEINSGCTIYAVKLDALQNEERKSYATNMLHCFAAVRNEWISFDELANFFKLLKPWMTRPPIKNIKENISDWNRKSKRIELGDNHDEDEDDSADGCNVSEIHRICKKIDSDGIEVFRVHPNFARIIFQESDHTIKDIKALPVRINKRKNGEIVDYETLPGDDEKEMKIRKHLVMHKKIMRRLKNKIEEAKKVSLAFHESERTLEDLEKELNEYANYSLKRISKESKLNGNICNKKKPTGSVKTEMVQNNNEEPFDEEKNFEKNIPSIESDDELMNLVKN